MVPPFNRFSDGRQGKGRAMHGVLIALSTGFALALTLGGCGRSEEPPFAALPVGKAAPEIDGEDVDGVRFKLSDYRGKVVVLSFWGHW